MKFTYLAKTAEGKITKGNLEAGDQKSAEGILVGQALTPISVRPEDKKSSYLSVLGEKLAIIPLKEKMLFTRQLSTLVSAGIPISQSIQILVEQTVSKKFKEIILEISREVEGGSQLSECLAKHPRVFSSLYVNMVKAGEVGGILDESLERMASELEVEHKIISEIRGAMIYPVAILSLTVLVLVFMIIYLIPQMSGIFSSLGGEMPPSMKMLIGMSDFLKNWGILVLIGFVGFIFGLRYFLKHNKKTRLNWHKILIKLPAFGSAIQKLNISRFTRTLSSLLSSGVAVLEAMQVAGESTNNEVYRHEIFESIDKVKNGSSISEALSTSKYFPVVVTQTIAVGEETGSTDKILVKLTEYYEDEVSNFTKGISDLILPIMMILIGIAVGLMFYTVIVPISEIGNTIQ